MKNKKTFYTTKWITCTAMLTALVAATGFIPKIATPAGNIYWVDGAILIAAYITDPLAAFIAGGIGSLIYDVFASPAMMVPSLIIHGLQGAMVSTLLRYVFPKKREALWAAIAGIICAFEVCGGYFLQRFLTRGLPVAIVNIPRNIIQETIGIAIAVTVCYATSLKKQLAKNNLLPNFKTEILNKKENIAKSEFAATENECFKEENSENNN